MSDYCENGKPKDCRYCYIRAADYRFADKIKYYQGFTNSRNQQKEGTQNHELILLSTADDFTEADIVRRTEDIMIRLKVAMTAASSLPKNPL